MGQKDGLLLNSDDSDIPDLDLPTANVRKERSRLFSRARQNAETVIVRQQNCSVQIALILLFSAVVIAIAFLGFFTSYFSSQLEQLRNEPRYGIMTRELEIIKYEVNKIKLDIDMLRMMTSSPGTPTWNASSLLYTRLEHIESQINGIADKIQERVNAVADACIQGCQTVSKLVVSNNGTKYTLDSVSDKLKKKRSKVPQWSSIRDTPIVFTRAKHV
ncbi:Uncharacterized protein BM_BM574 [Brugia malayi]|uniref:Bm574 n=1 Tax=Brugia malayi TaxID=6279 RepID=A0A4E9FD33_BRUMA|nr:Uncharacterized protein BM_BM574 [Brugia malayi]VIO93888.1 Uncharacterized protein BM_BM574 [Brugia malayi]